MSRVASANKSYDSAPLKTPNFKEIVPAPGCYDRTKDETPHVAILMDEYGQTPDHYYLARKPPSIYQVKRKLNLSAVKTQKERVFNSKTHTGRERARVCVETVKKKKIENEKIKADKPRYDTSLGQLTKKFLKVLSDATDGIINLNTACGLLSVPKRRLYDITNVLEGAGLIEKISRNNIQWMGRVTSSPCASVGKKYDLEQELDILEAKENKLDEIIFFMKSQLESAKETDSKYQYVTSDDIAKIEDFSQNLLIAVKTAPLTDVVEPNENTLLITSKSTEIEAYFLLEDVSFTNILHQKALVKENSYQVVIKNNSLANNPERHNTPRDRESKCLLQCAGTMWSEGDTVIKNAFITEEDDIAPMGKHFLLQTEDQDLDLYPFSQTVLETVENYSFSLDDGEGLTDLFDCGFSCP